MGEIHACRVCMSTNVKLYNMFQNNLITAYELLTGLEVILENRLPSFICVVCSHLLLKFTEFRETCQKTHDLLIFSYQQNYEVSTEYIESLNLNYSPLTKLSAHILVHHDVTKTVHKDSKVHVLPTDYDASQTELDPVKTEECSNQFSDEVVMDDTEVNCKDDEAIEAETEVERPPRRYVGVRIKDTFTVTLLTAEQQLQELHTRKLSTNYRNSLYKCEKCFRGFKTEVTLRKHLARHDSVCGGHECKICLRRFSTARILRRHVINYHEKEYRCKLCSFVTKTNYQAVEHAEWHRGKVLFCNTCGTTFQNGSSYFKHVRLRHPSAEHVCDICGESFVGARGLKSLKMHARNAHKAAVEEEAKFVCDICGTKFKRRFDLKTHRRKHTGETPFACTFCPKKYARHENLKVHIRKHKGETPFPCDECPKRFADKGVLRRHRRVHTGEKPYPCDYCGKFLCTSQALKLHIKAVHLKEPTLSKRKVRKKEDELCMDDD